MKTKVCSKCLIEKEIVFFSVSSRGLLGRRSDCKECQKEYRSKNKTRIRELNKKWSLKNPLKSRSATIQEKTKKYKRKYHIERYYSLSLEQRLILNNKRKKRQKERLSCDINYRLKVNIRSRLNQAIKNNQKSGSAIKDLGCSVEELKTHLESQFLPNMSWGNYGLKGWEIDHIIPLASFDLTDFKQFKKACHYTNLQPLWAEDNRKKSKGKL